MCSNTGGAYKPTDKAGKWVHSLCSIWIPEVFTIANRNGSHLLTLNSLDKKRYRLKCNLCNQKGACIQCCYGRCATAAHPWCVLNNPQGFTRRVIKNEDGELLWEIFCKQHAFGINEPLKPKPKSKAIESNITHEDLAEVEEYSLSTTTNSRNNNSRNSNQKSNTNLQSYIGNTNSSNNDTVLFLIEKMKSVAMSHVFKYNMSAHQENIHNFMKSTTASTTDLNPSSSQVEVEVEDKEEEVIEVPIEDDDDDDDEDNRSKNKNNQKNKKSMKTTAKTEKLKNNDDESAAAPNTTTNTTTATVTATIPCPSQSFPLLTMSEWPGQTEGEAMDLAHFWNVVSMSFPEDHQPEVSCQCLKKICIVFVFFENPENYQFLTVLRQRSV